MRLTADKRASVAAASISFKSEREFAAASHIPRSTINDIINGRTNQVSEKVWQNFETWRKRLGSERKAIIKEGKDLLKQKSIRDIKETIRLSRQERTRKQLKQFLRQSQSLAEKTRAKYYWYRITGSP